MKQNAYIPSPESLVTTHEELRAGFLGIALDKERTSSALVQEALAFRDMASDATDPGDLARRPELRPCLLAAAGISDKALRYLNDEAKDTAIQRLIAEFLHPAGDRFVDEMVYRYLIIQGEAIGGRTRNAIGRIAQSELVRAILNAMGAAGVLDVDMLERARRGSRSSLLSWHRVQPQDAGIEDAAKVLCWKRRGEPRMLAFDHNVRVVGKNVDICLFRGTELDYMNHIVSEDPTRAIMLGELKGGYDPAGSDEHWKTASTALGRIRASYAAAGCAVATSFVGSAIVGSVAAEIFGQLKEGTLGNAANLNKADQLQAYCEWILKL